MQTRRDHIQRSLRSLADAYAATMRLMEQTLELLYEEAALDPLTYMQTQFSSASSPSSGRLLVVDPHRFLVRFEGRECFLGNTYSFRFLSRLARRPNLYVKYEDLLTDVWQGKRSDATVRSASLPSFAESQPSSSSSDAIPSTWPSDGVVCAASAVRSW